MAEELTTGSHPRGCMMMMAAATSANASPALRKVLAEKRVAARDHMRLRIKRGIDEGDVPAGTDPGALAHFYSTLVPRLSLHARRPPPPQNPLPRLRRLRPKVSGRPALSGERAPGDTRATGARRARPGARPRSPRRPVRVRA